MKFAAVLAAPALVGAVAAESYGATIVDQANTPTAWQNHNISASAPLGQEFVPNHTAIGFIDVRIADAGGDVGPGADIQVRLRSGSITGTVLGTSATVRATDNQSGYYRFNFASPVSVTPADVHVLEVVKVSTGANVANFMLSRGQFNSYLSGRPVIEGSTDPTFGNPDNADFLFVSGRNTNTGPATSGTFGAFAYRGITDENQDGTGDSLASASFVSRTSGVSERRAVFEYDVARFAGGIQSATISGEMGANNSLDTGTRTVRMELFDGDGNITVSDFQIAATPHPQTFSYHPPADGSVAFTIDITNQLKALLAGGADFLGARFTGTNDQSVSVFTDADSPVLNVVVPEPGAISLAAIALGASLLRRRRRSRSA